MASDIDEPFRLSFQADSIHSGSISFGRYEREGLCWERRSSFSHNRYLEEVEKFSKPGLVIEKKAYFEAHFKKKALQGQTSLASENENENEIFDSVRCQEELQHVNEGIHITNYDTYKAHSAEDKEPEPPESDTRVPYANSFPLPVIENEDSVNKVTGNVTPEVHEAETENSFHQMGADVKEMENLNSDLRGESSDVSSKAISANNMPEIDDSVSSNDRSIPPLKGKIRCQNQLEIARFTSPGLAVQPKKNTASEASISSAKKPARRASNPSIRNKSAKPLPDAATSAVTSAHRPVKHEVAHNAMEKLLSQNRSGQKFRNERAVYPQPSVLKKAISRVDDTSSRKSISSQKLVGTQDAVSFRSKEKLEQKKEEKVAADMKQLRKSLNFKATPIPSFYYEPERSIKNKAFGNSDSKLTKVQNKSPSLGNRAAASVHSINPVRFPVKSTKPTDHAAACRHINQGAADSDLDRKEEKGKLKNPSPWKQRAPERSKVNLDQRGVSAERGRSYVTRQDGKNNNGLRSHSRTRNVVVGVVS